MSEKSEQPTPKRLREARRKGQVARSRLFSSSVVTMAALASVLGALSRGTTRLVEWTRALLMAPDLERSAALDQALHAGVTLALPSLASAFAAALVVSAATAGWVFLPEQVTPQLERISPTRGIAQLVSAKRLIEVGKSLVVIALLTALVWAAIQDEGPRLYRVVLAEGVVALPAALGVLRALLIRGAALLVVVGGADYLLARRAHLRELMMSRDEVKREHKDSEGDPQHKAKRRAVHRQLGQGGTARGLRHATALVVNPTHVAVALRYVPKECEAPYLVAKGREEDALALRREAERCRIPIVQDIPLARSLVHYDVGEEIPEELYQAAAAVLRVAMASEDGGERRNEG